MATISGGHVFPMFDKYRPQLPGDLSNEKRNMFYVEKNIIWLPFPNVHRIDYLASQLKAKHPSKYMIWNISEETYDYSKFDNQVLEFNFPGYPAPPLGILFKICTSIDNWLKADANHVAAIHCLTGKGRTAVVIACCLAWIKESKSPIDTFYSVCERHAIASNSLLNPSQKRYLHYFSYVMNGIKPRSSPLLFKRIIMNTVPNFGSKENKGCRPYIQLFKRSKLIFSTVWSSPDGISWVAESDGSVSFPIECLVQGDLLLRCRHIGEDGRGISIFRAAFHTGYISQGILRLTKSQLDAANSDNRFDSDFFIDLIFASIEKREIQTEGLFLKDEDKKAYDAMLNRDEVFWHQISSRPSNNKKENQLSKNQFSIADTNLNVDEMVYDFENEFGVSLASQEEVEGSFEENLAELEKFLKSMETS